MCNRKLAISITNANAKSRLARLSVSFAACVTGLFLLSDHKQMQADELEETEQTLFKMSFTWIVYRQFRYSENRSTD